MTGSRGAGAGVGAAGGAPAPGEGWPGGAARPVLVLLQAASVKLAPRRTVQNHFVMRHSLRTTPVFIHPEGSARKLLFIVRGRKTHEMDGLIPRRLCGPS